MITGHTKEKSYGLSSVAIFYIKDWKNKSNYHKLPLILHVSGTNIPAVNLYRSEGFTVAEEIKYYTLNLNNLI